MPAYYTVAFRSSFIEDIEREQSHLKALGTIGSPFFELSTANVTDNSTSEFFNVEVL